MKIHQTPDAGPLTGDEYLAIDEPAGEPGVYRTRRLKSARLLGNGSPAALSSPDLRVTARCLAGDDKVLEVQIIFGDSKAMGTADRRAFDTVAKYPANLWTIEVNGGVGPQAPVLAGHAITGLTPLLECAGRSSPIVTNPIDGEPIDWGTGWGQTAASSQGIAYLEAVEKATGKRPHVLLAVVALGGRTYPELKLGSYHFGRILEVYRAALKYAPARGYAAVRFTGLFVSLGANDTVLDYTGQVTGTLTAEMFAASILQLKRDLWDCLAIAGPPQSPALYFYQCNRRFPPSPLHNRVSSVSAGLALAAREDPDIVVVNPEYQRQRVDTLHYTAEANVLNGLENAAAHLQHYAGIGQHRPLEPARDANGTARIIWNSPTEFDLIIATGGRRLRIVRHSVGDARLVDPGDNYVDDQLVAMVGGAGSADAIFRASACAGRLTGLAKVDSGGYDAPIDGPCALVPLPTTATVVDPGISYLDGARARLLGGVALRPLEGFLSVDEAGGLLAFTPIPGSRYSVVPTGNCAIEPLQGGGSGALVRLDGVAGSGATITSIFYRQFAVPDATPYLLNSAGNILTGANCVAGSKLEVQGGVLAPGATAATIDVALVDVDGKPTYAQIIRPGLYEQLPGDPVTAIGVDGAIATFALPSGGSPVSDPGQLGFRLRSSQYPFDDPDFSLDPRILDIVIVSLQGGTDNALRFRLAETPGSDTLLDHADTSIYGSFARGCIAAEPSTLVGPGPFGQDVQPWLLGFTIPLVSPWGQAAINHRPHLINREFADWPRGLEIGFGSIGGYGAAQWRGARGSGTALMRRIAGERGSFALEVRRADLDPGVSSYSASQILTGPDLDGLLGHLCNLTFHARALPGWSDPDGLLAFAVYSHTSDSDPLLSNGLPAGAVLLRNGNAQLDATLRPFAVSYTSSNQPNVPADARALILRFLAGAVGVAGPADGFVLELPDLYPGIERRPFVSEPLAATIARRRRYHDRIELAIGATGSPTRVLLREPMRAPPAVSTVGGDAAGFSAAGTTADMLAVAQTVAGTAVLDVSAEL